MPFLPDTEIATICFVALAAFLAGIARGFSGFGTALIFIPLAGALIGPKLGASVLVVIDAIFASYLIPPALKLGDRRDIGLMLAGALVGIPVGTAILAHAPVDTLRWLIAAMATAMLLLLLSGWRYRGAPHPLATVSVGAVSGLFFGIAQIGGPPVISYWLGGDTALARLRANITLYFAATTALSFLTYLWAGLMSFDALAFALYCGPAYGLGTIAGTRMFGLASPAVFRNSTLALIALAVLTSLPIFGR